MERADYFRATLSRCCHSCYVIAYCKNTFWRKKQLISVFLIGLRTRIGSCQSAVTHDAGSQTATWCTDNFLHAEILTYFVGNFIHFYTFRYLETLFSLYPFSVFVVHSVKSKMVLQRVSEKNSPNCFCHNFVKFSLNLIFFGMKMAKAMKLCKVHSLFISLNLC